MYTESGKLDLAGKIQDTMYRVVHIVQCTHYYKCRQHVQTLILIFEFVYKCRQHVQTLILIFWEIWGRVNCESSVPRNSWKCIITAGYFMLSLTTRSGKLIFGLLHRLRFGRKREESTKSWIQTKIPVNAVFAGIPGSIPQYHRYHSSEMMMLCCCSLTFD